jgi:hypothetical protein
MPAIMGKAKAQQRLIDNLEEEILRNFRLHEFLNAFSTIAED